MSKSYFRPRASSKVATGFIALTILSGGALAALPVANAAGNQPVITQTAGIIANNVHELVELNATGSIKSVTISDETKQKLADLGLTYNEAETLKQSNDRADNFETGYVTLFFDIDKDKFAASEAGAHFDLDAQPVDENGKAYPVGFKLQVGVGNVQTGVAQKKANAPLPKAHAGTVALSFQGFDMEQDKGKAMVVAAPVVQKFIGGVVSNDGDGSTSSYSESYLIDTFEPSDTRNEQLIASGNRAFDYNSPDTTIMSRDSATTGVYGQIQYYGVEKDSTDGLPRSLTLIDPFWISIESDYSIKSAPKAFGKDKAEVLGDGTRLWYELIKSDSGINPARDLTNPNAKILPQNTENSGANYSPYAGEIVELGIRQDSATGGIQVVNVWDSEFFGSTTKPTVKGAVDTSNEERTLERAERALESQRESIAELQELVNQTQAELDEAIASGASERTVQNLERALADFQQQVRDWEAPIDGLIKAIDDARIAFEKAKTDNPSNTYTFTWDRYSILPSEAPKQWTMEGSVLEVGQQWTSSVGDVTAVFTVTENEDNRLVVEMNLSEAMNITEWNGPAQVSTGIGSYGAHDLQFAHGYWAQFAGTPTLPPVTEPPVVEPPVVEPPVVEPPVVEPPVVEPPVVEPPVVEPPVTVTTTTEIEPGTPTSTSETRDSLANSAAESDQKDLATSVGLALFAGICASVVGYFAKKTRKAKAN